MPPPLSSDTFSWLTLIVHGGMSTDVTGWPSTMRERPSVELDTPPASVEVSCFGTVITIGSKRDLGLTSPGLGVETVFEIRARSPISALKDVGVGPGEMTTLATELSDGVVVTVGVGVGSATGSDLG